MDYFLPLPATFAGKRDINFAVNRDKTSAKLKSIKGATVLLSYGAAKKKRRCTKT